MKNIDVMFASKTCEWATPEHVFRQLDDEFHFTLDPCSTHENAKCAKHYTVEDDGLKQDWTGETVFCNPPYGREMPQWIEKCATEDATCVMLIPSRTDTEAFHKWIYGKAELRFVRGRIKFGGAKYNAPFPSMIVIFRRKNEG
jgi:site-specific DNA-methyltransferase (adenine-specific)